MLSKKILSGLLFKGVYCVDTKCKNSVMLTPLMYSAIGTRHNVCSALCRIVQLSQKTRSFSLCRIVQEWMTCFGVQNICISLCRILQVKTLSIHKTCTKHRNIAFFHNIHFVNFHPPIVWILKILKFQNWNSQQMNVGEWNNAAWNGHSSHVKQMFTKLRLLH